MYLLEPITITESMLGAGTTIAEPGTGETAWVSGGSYTAGNYRIRTTTHRKYLCRVTHTGVTTLPEDDATNWADAGPTLRHAPFDTYISTPATATSTLTYVISPGFFDACALYGAVGSTYAVTVKDAPGGSIIATFSGSLYRKGPGWFNWAFGTRRSLSKQLLSDVPLRPTAEITITITGPSQVELGMVVLGRLIPLFGRAAPFGGTLQGATAEPVTYSYINTDSDGTVSIVRRTKATGMRASVVLPTRFADQALELVQSVLDIPAALIATKSSGFDGLNVFGLVSGSLSYDGPNVSNLSLTVKGMI